LPVIETSISKDILMLTRVDKPALLKRLFEIGCLWSGQILSYTKITGQLQDAGNTTTLANYLNLLSECGLLAGLEVKSGIKADNPGMRVFSERFRPAKIFLIGTGGMPLEEFLKINPKELF
jgi:predicted AAA+ superfamily ATPase